MVQIDLLLPETLLEVTYFLIGFMAGRAGALCDNQIKNSEWYKRRCSCEQSVISGLLDFTHHFWIGLLLMVEIPREVCGGRPYWFGMGLFVDDMPDIPARFKKWFGYLSEKLRG